MASSVLSTISVIVPCHTSVFSAIPLLLLRTNRNTLPLDLWECNRNLWPAQPGQLKLHARQVSGQFTVVRWRISLLSTHICLEEVSRCNYVVSVLVFSLPRCLWLHKLRRLPPICPIPWNASCPRLSKPTSICTATLSSRGTKSRPRLLWLGDRASWGLRGRSPRGKIREGRKQFAWWG